MKQLKFKRDDLGVFIEIPSNVDIPTFINEHMCSELKLDEIINKKKLVKSMYEKLLGFLLRKGSSEFAKILYSKKVNDEIVRILDSHELLDVDEKEISSHNSNTYLNMLYGVYKDLLHSDECYLDGNKICTNLGIYDCIDYAKKVRSKLERELENIREIGYEIDEADGYSDKYDYDDVYEREELLTNLYYIFEEYVEDASTYLEELMLAISEGDSPSSRKEGHYDGYSQLFNPKHIEKFIKESDDFIVQVLKDMDEFINYKKKDIHKSAVNKIKNSEFYNNSIDVQDKLSDVEGLEIEYVRFPEISLDSKDGKTKNKVYMVMRKTGKK